MRITFLTFLFTFILISCSKPEQGIDSENSDFLVSEITSSSISLVSANIQSSNIPSDIKDKAIYNLKICLKDPAVNNPIVGNEFVVDIAGVSQKILTDMTGCSSLFVELNERADSCEKVVFKNAIVKGHGLYRGSTKIKLAFNKTGKTTNSFMDTRYISVDNLDNGDCEKSEIIVSALSLKHQKDSKNLIFEVRMDMALKKFSRDNSFDLIGLNGQSQFEIEYLLLADGQEGIKILDIVKSEATLSELGLNDHVKFKVSSKSAGKYSNFRLQFSVGLKDQNIFDKKFYEVSAKNLFFDQFSNIVSLERLAVNSDTDIVKEDSFSHESVDLSDLIVVKESLSSSMNELQAKNKKMTLRTCFIDAFDGSSLEDHSYKDVLVLQEKIKSLSIEKSNIKTDVNGCMTFDLVYNYKLFTNMVYEKSSLKFVLENKTYSIAFAVHAQKPFVDLRKSSITKEEEINVEHELVVDNFTYGQLGNKDNSYFVNRFIQMYFEKKFFLEFSPSVLSRNKGRELDLATSINFGKLKIKYHYLIGKDVEKSGDDLDLSKFDIISSSESVAQISKTGTVYTQFHLPLEVGDAIYLATKGYLVLDIIPLDELADLAPVRMAFEFYGTSTKENTLSITQMILPEIKDYISDESETHLERLMKKGFANKTSKLSSDLFFDYLKNIPKFSSLLRINTKQALERDDFRAAQIDASDMRLIAKIEKRIPKSGGLSEKLCALIYPNLLEVIKRRDCNKSIESHLSISSGEHIEELVYLNLFEQRNKVASANFERSLEVNDGSITRGYGYMASGGDRSGVTKGEHSGVSESISSSIFYDGPPGVLMLSAGISKSHEVFTNTDNSKFQMLMNRYSSELTPVKLSYNAIGLSFPASIKKCTLIEALKIVERSLFICDENVVKKMITQKWFYIGEMDARRNGVLTDGVKVGEKSYLKIIRGEEVFNQIWSKFKQEDSKALIVEIEGESLGEKLLEYKKSETIKLEFEINKDGNFPGLLK